MFAYIKYSVTDVMTFFKAARKELINWTQDVVTPLTQQLKIQQKMIANHQLELTELSKSRANLEGKIKGINRLISELDMEAQTATEIIESLGTKKGNVQQSNVVDFKRVAR